MDTRKSFILFLSLLVILIASSPAQAERFVDKNDGTVYDRQTGLLWLQIDTEEGLYWKDALRYCADYCDTQERCDYRLPNYREMSSVFEETDYGAPVQFNFYGVRRAWTNTTSPRDDNYAWVVDFSSKTVLKFSKGGYRWPARCVRGGH